MGASASSGKFSKDKMIPAIADPNGCVAEKICFKVRMINKLLSVRREDQRLNCHKHQGDYDRFEHGSLIFTSSEFAIVALSASSSSTVQAEKSLTRPALVLTEVPSDWFIKHFRYVSA